LQKKQVAAPTSLRFKSPQTPTKRGLSSFAESAEQKGTVPLSGSAFENVSLKLTPIRHSDSAVRQAAFEDDGPQLTSGTGVGNTRSVVVNRDNAPNELRSAQRSTSATGAAGQTDASSQLNQNIGTPFGSEMPEPPPIEPTTPSQLEPSNLPMPETPPPQDTLQPGAPAGQLPPPSSEFQPNVPPTGQSPRDAAEPVPEPIAPVTQPELQRAQTSCQESLDRLKQNTIDKLSIEIGVTGNEGSDYPYECTIDDGSMYGGRCWDQTIYQWKASALCHKPLYFEDEQLERYGHSFSPCFQPFVSGAHFFCRLPVLPYCMGVEPPHECIYALGHYRPGNCAPYMCNPIPISCRGAAIQAGAVTGAVYAIP
jgi:hypothetical protein